MKFNKNLVIISLIIVIIVLLVYFNYTSTGESLSEKDIKNAYPSIKSQTLEEKDIQAYCEEIVPNIIEVDIGYGNVQPDGSFSGAPIGARKSGHLLLGNWEDGNPIKDSDGNSYIRNEICKEKVGSFSSPDEKYNDCTVLKDDYIINFNMKPLAGKDFDARGDEPSDFYYGKVRFIPQGEYYNVIVEYEISSISCSKQNVKTTSTSPSKTSDEDSSTGYCEKYVVPSYFELKYNPTVRRFYNTGVDWKDGTEILNPRAKKQIGGEGICRVGNKAGENANYYYCEDLLYSKTPVSEDGTIQDTIKYTIDLVISKGSGENIYEVIDYKCSKKWF
jgi:hypothetical protein